LLVSEGTEVVLVRRVLAIIVLLGWVPFLLARNDCWEFCTTRAYGHPLPVYVDWCPCEKTADNLQVAGILLDLLFLAGIWWLVCWVLTGRKKRSVS
jgi:hypothetical protein